LNAKLHECIIYRTWRFKFFHGQAHAYEGKDQAKQKEMVLNQQEENKKQEELQINGRKQQHNEKKEIEELQLELDKDWIQNMLGNNLRKQL
jgi:hypothetical protein